ncbi:hypothetical protein C8E87_4432 [Paractinoplanes brasiliensis]|uniref:Uncharacterized protein n=1 Tax=Paractinoplanes brasiliensis TaxID=52695 RepID=A0A4R6JVE7_9ACTN|nr:hypothetical protein C8E87_4432 [Actinoplanes brasiliensis]
MTRRRQTSRLVPVDLNHRRTWRSLWRRCRCGLAAPCVDALVPSAPLPFPPRPDLSPPSQALAKERRYSHAENTRPGMTESDPTALSRCSPGGPHSPARRPQKPPGSSGHEPSRQPAATASRRSATATANHSLRGFAGRSAMASASCPGATTPSRSGTTTPSRPGATTPSRSGTTTPSRPGATTPSRSGTTTPSRPGATTPSRSGTTTPSRPGATTPSRSGTTTPSRPGATTSSRSGTTTPSRPGATTPSRSGTTTSSRSGAHPRGQPMNGGGRRRPVSADGGRVTQPRERRPG